MNLSLQTEQHVISWDHHLSGSNPRQDSHIAAHSISLRANLFSQGLLGRPGHHPLKKWLYGSKFLNPPKWTYQNWICSYMIPIYLTSKLVSLWWSHSHLGPFSVIHRAKGASPTKPWHKLGSWWWVIDVFCGLCMLQRVKKKWGNCRMKSNLWPMVHVCERPSLKKRNKNTPLAHFKTQGAVKNSSWKSPTNFPLPSRIEATPLQSKPWLFPEVN